MKICSFLLAFSLVLAASAQEQSRLMLPINITIFSESLGLPGLRSFFKNPNLGVRVGTELYYSSQADRQLYQTISVGYYRHRDFHSGFFVSSDFGYRKFFGNAFVDGSLGLGYMIVKSALPRYERTSNGYQRTSDTFGRIVPALGIGAGYRFNNLSVFSRYELFGEMPFGFKGLPALPHQTLHLGTRINLNK